MIDDELIEIVTARKNGERIEKLIMLRDCHNGYTNPLKSSKEFYIDVDIREGKKGVHTFTGNSLCSRRTPCHILQFHTAELRDEFKKNFEDLIMEAAELLI